ncbi:hypothetical protein JCM10914A_47730 [Paenibacillus sp. JCM 10914]
MVDLGIVMPVYKQKPEFLKAALDSVLNQTFEQFRFVIVIDGAPEMEPLVQSIVANDPRVNIIAYDINQGVPHALNTGFAELFQHNGIHFLTWVSSDNIYGPQFLEVLRLALLKGPEELGLVYSSFQSIDNYNTPLNDEVALSALRKYQGKPKEALLDSSIVGVSFMYKAKYAKMVQGGYSLAPVEDYDYWLKITDFCEIKYIPVELMAYRVDSTYSVSAQLKTTEAHRHWRHAYHLARHQARMRRGIGPEVNILFPLSEVSDHAIQRIENLYEQMFSNYVCYVLDLSLDQRVTIALMQISHPTAVYEWYPGWQPDMAALAAVRKHLAPYTMLLDLNEFKNVMDLHILHNQLSKTGYSIWSSYYTDDHSIIGYRTEHMAESILTNELLRTHRLDDLLVKKTKNAGDGA